MKSFYLLKNIGINDRVGAVGKYCECNNLLFVDERCA